jgi:hypothetical protein
MIKPVFKMQFIVNKEYRMDYEVKNIKMDAEFKICPTCGYKDGFHSMFKKEFKVQGYPQITQIVADYKII